MTVLQGKSQHKMGKMSKNQTLTESTGYIAQCSAIPATAPAVATIFKGVEAGKLSYSSASAIFHFKSTPLCRKSVKNCALLRNLFCEELTCPPCNAKSTIVYLWYSQKMLENAKFQILWGICLVFESFNVVLESWMDSK